MLSPIAMQSGRGKWMSTVILKSAHRQGHIQGNEINYRHQKIGHKHGEGSSIDAYAYASKIRDWNSVFKVSFPLLTLMLVIVLNNPYVSMAVIIAMAYLTIVVGGLSIQAYLSILAIPISFILLGTFTIGIDFSTLPIGQYNLYLGFGYVFTSQAQLKIMFFLMLKVFGAISAMEMMTLSTPSFEIISVLQRAHVPKLIAELMSLIYRYIFTLMDVNIKMRNSADSRLGFCDLKTSWYTFGKIASNILIVSFKKADAYYNAMEARCYDGDLIFLEEVKKVKTRQITKAVVFIIFLILLWGFTR